MKPIVYLHGFNSSPASAKAQQLSQQMQRLGLADYLHIPALARDPAQAIADLATVCQRLEQPLLVGSSLGGYYATILAQRFELSALLINPAVQPWLLLRDYLGWQRCYHSQQPWLFTEQHLQALEGMQVAPPNAPERIHVWLQSGDQTLDYRQAAAFYRHCTVHVEEGGDHSYSGFIQRLPDLLRLADYSPV